MNKINTDLSSICCLFLSFTCLPSVQLSRDFRELFNFFSMFFLHYLLLNRTFLAPQ